MAGINCPLCGSKGSSFFLDEKHHFFSCNTCGGIYRNPDQILNLMQEKKRYLLHQNHLEDKGYLKFASPILEAVKTSFDTDAVGLDFGCGHTPVISEVLKSEGYSVDLYDPVFYPDRTFENKTYDFVVSCEVMEHFQHPKKEFDLLSDLIKPHGKLICMTSLFSEQMDFNSWYYKNDPTHVFLYRKKTMDYIARNWGFNPVKVEKSLIVFSK